MTIGALPRRDGMHAGQGKASRGVIELAIGPLHCVMALLTRSRESDVRHRRCRGGEILLVAGVARAAA